MCGRTNWRRGKRSRSRRRDASSSCGSGSSRVTRFDEIAAELNITKWYATKLVAECVCQAQRRLPEEGAECGLMNPRAQKLAALVQQLERERLTAKLIVQQVRATIDAIWEREVPESWRTPVSSTSSRRHRLRPRHGGAPGRFARHAGDCAGHLHEARVDCRGRADQVYSRPILLGATLCAEARDLFLEARSSFAALGMLEESGLVGLELVETFERMTAVHSSSIATDAVATESHRVGRTENLVNGLTDDPNDPGTRRARHGTRHPARRPV